MISAILNKEIIIEKGTVTINASGTPNLTWAEYHKTWAGVYTPYRNVQYIDGEMLVYTTEFTIRYSSKTKDINNKYRIYYNSNYYKILQISEIGNKEGIKIVTIAWENE